MFIFLSSSKHLSRSSHVTNAFNPSSSARNTFRLLSTIQTNTLFTTQKNNVQTKKLPTSRPILYYQPTNLESRRYQNTRIKATTSMNDDVEELQEFLQEATSTNDFFASEKFPTFESIGLQSNILIERVHSFLGKDNSSNGKDDIIPKPSAIQAASYKAIQSGNDVTIGAETGSGKTLAYLLPLLDDIIQSKMNADSNVKASSLSKNDSDDGFYDEYDNESITSAYSYARAVILVPNKELANQVIRMATPLCGGEASIIWGTNGEEKLLNTADVPNQKEVVRIGFLPGELKTPDDYKPFRVSINDPQNNPPLDLLVCTPASLGPWGLNPKNIDIFADIRTIVIDEADMLFDGGYLRQLENTLLGFKRADRLDASFGVPKTQHVLVAATLPSMGTKSVDAYVQRKFPYATRVTMKGMHNARHYGLGEQTLWVEDDFDEMMPKKKRMERLVKILKTNPDDLNTKDDIGLLGEKVMVFLNNVNDVDSATNALRRSGIEAVPFHAKLPLAERTQNLSRFRKFVAGKEDMNEEENGGNSGPISVLVCTDLAARGLDIPGVTAVVQLQFAGNVVTHLHRMGRCGRAGKRDGRGVIFYGGVESELVGVVREAEQQQETMILKGNEIEEQADTTDQGKVEAAFSRRRGFTRKRKKLRRAVYDEE